MNPHRGEVALTIDGERHRLRLTLGALAELEAAVGAQSLSDMVERFESGAFRSRDLIALLGAGLRACGWQGTDADLAEADIEGGPIVAARVGARLLALAFQGADAT